MDQLTQYSVNIAMEVTVIMILVIILITLFWQKKLFVTTIPLISLTISIILMILVQIVSWLFLILNVPMEYGAMPMRIAYILDYITSYGSGISFYYYLEALAIDGYQQTGITYESKKHIKIIIFVFGIVTSLIYAGLLFVPSLYHMEDGKGIYSIPAYIAVHIITKFAYICALIFGIRHRKVIGKREMVINFVFIILLSALVVVDELYELCIGHVFVALFVFTLYVSIDLHKGLLLERQEKDIVLWKTQIMLSQMQPHFLYNVLTTISSMCEMENANEARDVVNHFADYFRTNLDSLGNNKTIPFDKELEHTKTYLWLEKVRFEDSLNICYEIGTTDFMVPSLTVQPIVENAVKHGIHPKEDGGTVTISTYETSRDYVIVVKDDGVGFDINEKKNDNHTHVGIENVRKRLEMTCNGICDIKSEKGKGTIVTIYIPREE